MTAGAMVDDLTEIGATYALISRCLGVHPSTLTLWRTGVEPAEYALSKLTRLHRDITLIAGVA